MVQELPFRNRKIEPIVKDRLVDGVWPQFIKPYPLNDKYFLVTAKLNENALWGIYLVDVYDNLTLIAEYEGEGLIHPIPVKKTPVPPVVPDRTKPDTKEATVFIQDIYEGEGLKGVPRGTVKAFRVLSYEYAYNKTPSDHWAQGVQSGWDIKRLLGTVPVEGGWLGFIYYPGKYTDLTTTARLMRTGCTMDAKLADRYAGRNSILYRLPRRPESVTYPEAGSGFND